MMYEVQPYAKTAAFLTRSRTSSVHGLKEATHQQQTTTRKHQTTTETRRKSAKPAAISIMESNKTTQAAQSATEFPAQLEDQASCHCDHGFAGPHCTVNKSSLSWHSPKKVSILSASTASVLVLSSNEILTMVIKGVLLIYLPNIEQSRTVLCITTVAGALLIISSLAYEEKYSTLTWYAMRFLPARYSPSFDSVTMFTQKEICDAFVQGKSAAPSTKVFKARYRLGAPADP
ncbi:hypothetical protein OSTOST_03140, partial [Ostertagia ostertagi]